MWIRRKKYDVLLTELARLTERAKLRDESVKELEQFIAQLKEERDEFKDDLRRLLGLKPRVIVQPAQQEGDVAVSDSPNRHFKLKESPRDVIGRMQRESDAAVKVEDQAAIRAAIAEYEVLTRK